MRGRGLALLTSRCWSCRCHHEQRWLLHRLLAWGQRKRKRMAMEAAAAAVLAVVGAAAAVGMGL